MSKTKQQRIEELEDELEVLDEKWLATVSEWIEGRNAIDTVAAILYCQDKQGSGLLGKRDTYERGMYDDKYYMPNDPYKYGDYNRISYREQPRDLGDMIDLFGRLCQTSPSAARDYMDRAKTVLAGVNAAMEEASIKAII